MGLGGGISAKARGQNSVFPLKCALVIITRVRFPSPAPFSIHDLHESAGNSPVLQTRFFTRLFNGCTRRKTSRWRSMSQLLGPRLTKFDPRPGVSGGHGPDALRSPRSTAPQGVTSPVVCASERREFGLGKRGCFCGGGGVFLAQGKIPRSLRRKPVDRFRPRWAPDLRGNCSSPDSTFPAARMDKPTRYRNDALPPTPPLSAGGACAVRSLA